MCGLLHFCDCQFICFVLCDHTFFILSHRMTSLCFGLWPFLTCPPSLPAISLSGCSPSPVHSSSRLLVQLFLPSHFHALRSRQMPARLQVLGKGAWPLMLWKACAPNTNNPWNLLGLLLMKTKSPSCYPVSLTQSKNLGFLSLFLLKGKYSIFIFGFFYFPYPFHLFFLLS